MTEERGNAGNGAGSGGVAPHSELPPHAIATGQSFLWSLLSAIRTAAHNPTEASLDQATTQVLQAAEALHKATGGFSIKLADHAAFLNGFRLSFEGGTYGKLLRERLEAKGLGGIGMKKAPTIGAVRKLLSLFVQDPKLFADRSPSGVTAPQAPTRPPSAPKAGPAVPIIRGKPVDAAEQAHAPVIPSDRRALAVRTYAKLCLAIHEQLLPPPVPDADPGGEADAHPRPRIKPVRAVQELVSMAIGQADLLLRLVTLRTETISLEVTATNAAVLSVVLGHALGLPRRNLVDLGMATLLHVAGRRPAPPGSVAAPSGEAEAKTTSSVLRGSVARLLSEPDPLGASQTRAFIIAELSASGTSSAAMSPHLFSRIARVAAAYSELVSGVGIGIASGTEDLVSSVPGIELDPRDAIVRLKNDPADRFDPDLVDLLCNLLRVFPLDEQVLLDSGEHAVVMALGAAWDRPIVRTLSGQEREIDLSAMVEGRFLATIAGTRRFFDLGKEPNK